MIFSLDDSFLERLGRIAVLSTSRADSGIYAPLIRALVDGGFDTVCLAGGTHLDDRYGRTIDDLLAIDGLRTIPVEHGSGDDSAAGVAASAGGALAAFGAALSEAKPDLAFVLGDRVEMLAAATASVVQRIPLAHLHGGERTAGAYDDKCRDALTMLSDMHFAALPWYAERIRAMGMAAGRVWCVGALAIDTFASFEPMSVEETSRAVGLDFAKPTLLVLFHPETLSDIPAAEQAKVVASALRNRSEQLLIFGVNADVGRKEVVDELQTVVARRDGAKMLASARPQVFHSCMAHARAMVGNSSCGLIEAPSFQLPVVNIGNRQGGRVRAGNVIDVPFDSSAITASIQRATSDTFRSALREIINPFGDGRAAERIVGVLARDAISEFT